MKKLWILVGLVLAVLFLYWERTQGNPSRAATVVAHTEPSAPAPAQESIIMADPTRRSVPSMPAPARDSPTVQEHQAQRPLADSLRMQYAVRQSSASAPKAEPPTLSEEEGKHLREYIQKAVHEQYFPIATGCYVELLGRHPEASGLVELDFSIVHSADAGVVDEVTLGEGSTIHDPEFELCMRESMYSTVFEPPPHGVERHRVVYPIELSPE